MTTTTSIFDAIRGRVTALDAAQHYGITVHRGMARCPFHGDRTPSMKIDSRYHCFGCQADGDAVDFTARLFGLSPYNAAKKLAADFGVSYDAGYTPPPAKPVINKHDTIQRYAALLREWKYRYAPKTLEVAKACMGMGMNKFAAQAPICIVISEMPYVKSAAVGAKVKKNDYRSIDIGITTAYLTAEATAQGLSTCILGWLDNEKISKICSLEHPARLVITLGYAKEDDKLRTKKRKDLEELVTYQN